MSSAATQATAAAGQAVTAYGEATGASWVPIVGPIIAGVSLAIGLLVSRKGPWQREATTQIVNELEPLLQQNLEGYLSGPRTPESQQVALANFDAAWSWLVSSEGCGTPNFGDPGRACIADRSRGGKWDWFAYYRDPIALDTPRQAAGVAKISAELAGGSSLALWAGLGLILLALASW